MPARERENLLQTLARLRARTRPRRASCPRRAAGGRRPSRPPRAASTRRPSSSPSTLPGGASAAPGSRRPSNRRSGSPRQSANAPGLRIAAADQAVELARRRASSRSAPPRRSRVPAPSPATRPAATPRAVPAATAATASTIASIAERIQPLEVEAARAVGVADLDAALLDHDRPGVDAGVGPEHGHARLALAEDDLPGERRAAAEARQQRRVEAERAVHGGIHDLGRQDRRHEREHVELGAERAVLRHQLGQRRAGAAEAAMAEQREPARRGLGSRADRAAPRRAGRRRRPRDARRRAGARARPCRRPPDRRARCAAPCPEATSTRARAVADAAAHRRG